ncbi:MAG: hypothetical protein H0U23_08085, partial [Blastocatellia bacterium]|nr:hypothetical protein [Blastocatellia bacterium]
MSERGIGFTLPFTPDGDPGCYLTGYIYTPPIQFGTGPWPAIIATRAGGYTLGGVGESNNGLEKLSDVGYVCMFFDVPLAKDGTAQAPGLLPTGRQTIDGKWAQQTDVYVQAITYMRSRTDICNGFVGGYGGSGSGAHSAWCAVNGTAGTTRLDSAICLSGNLDAGDRSPEVLARPPFISKVSLYFRLADIPANLPTFTARSAIANVASTQAPIYFANGMNESMPFSQYTLFKAKCDNAVPPVTNYVSHVNTENNGGRHSFGTFDENELAIKDFLAAAVAAWGEEPPPPIPPPAGGLVKGITCLMGAGTPVPAAALSSPAISAISLRVPWYTVQPTPVTFNFGYFTIEMINALSVNPKLKFLLLVQTGDTNRKFGGFKPTWLHTLLATDPKIDVNAVVTAGSPTVTFPSPSTITVGDVGKRVYLSSKNATTGVWQEHFNPIAAYIGVRTSSTSIGISSSPSSNVPLNALVGGSQVMIEAWTPGGVDLLETNIVPGTTYSFLSGNKIINIPVPWNDVLNRRKRLLYTKMGEWLAGLPLDIRNAVSVIRTSFVNTQGDDWHIPDDATVFDIPGNPLSQTQRWLNLPTDPEPGAGYTTQKIVDIAATANPVNQVFTTGEIQGNQLKCKEAGFSVEDIGKIITGVGVGPNNTNTITAVGITTSVQGAYAQLAVAGTTGAVASFTMYNRKTGLFDV